MKEYLVRVTADILPELFTPCGRIWEIEKGLPTDIRLQLIDVTIDGGMVVFRFAEHEPTDEIIDVDVCYRRVDGVRGE